MNRYSGSAHYYVSSTQCNIEHAAAIKQPKYFGTFTVNKRVYVHQVIKIKKIFTICPEISNGSEFCFKDLALS